MANFAVCESFCHAFSLLPLIFRLRDRCHCHSPLSQAGALEVGVSGKFIFSQQMVELNLSSSPET